MSILGRLIVAAVVLVATAAAQCPTDFFQSGTGCFGIIDLPGVNMTWQECRDDCQAISSAEWTVDLASFDDCDDLETFSQTWREVGGSYPTHPYMWMGVHKVNDNWQTVEGQPISLQNPMWEIGHPHTMGVAVFLDDIEISQGLSTHGRLYWHCSMGTFEHHSRCLCRAR
ncbi:hypothetical protein Pcinc_011184 [Petrolisthes cinctipes]|uniref:C-type lectin n=1 Tax=Petrolisthes cinctipes TaxID=88211 RepID=A0AAE1KWM7_PETCI|nr:hypothetical protein Pcinc_011184 [Petrolisthes cinctipes]